MIANAFEFEYTCKVETPENSFQQLNDGTYILKKWFETERALSDCLIAWTKQGYSGIYIYSLTPENITNNSKQKSFPIDVYDKFSDCPGMTREFITTESFRFYARRKQ